MAHEASRKEGPSFSSLLAAISFLLWGGPSLQLICYSICSYSCICYSRSCRVEAAVATTAAATAACSSNSCSCYCYCCYHSRSCSCFWTLANDEPADKQLAMHLTQKFNITLFSLLCHTGFTSAADLGRVCENITRIRLTQGKEPPKGHGPFAPKRASGKTGPQLSG